MKTHLLERFPEVGNWVSERRVAVQVERLLSLGSYTEEILRKRSLLSNLTLSRISRKMSNSSWLWLVVAFPRSNSQAVAPDRSALVETIVECHTPPVLVSMRCDNLT